MKTITHSLLCLILFVSALLNSNNSTAQISIACTNPTGIIYGLTSSGEIYGVNISTGATTVVKNNTYSGFGPTRANGMGFNFINKKFYYFKRNVGSANQQFVSFEPLTNTVSVLASSTCAAEVHTGSVNFTGTGYYTVDTDGNLNYYNIVANTWTFITSNIVDQNGNDVDAIIRTQDAGDMAMDGWGAIWLITSSNTNWGLYKFNAPLPTTAVASITVTRVIAPTQATPTGNSFAGIAFSPSGQIYMATKNDNRLYRLNNNLTLSFIAGLGTTDVGNDLTSCNFPFLVLPVSWKSFDVSAQQGNKVTLKWEVMEANNHGFYVQHSDDAKTWNDLTFVQSKSSQTETMSGYQYSYINKINGHHYYRIKQVDNDGKETYSEVKSIAINNNSTVVSVWPNPAVDQVRIANTGTVTFTRARIYDLSGRILIEKLLQVAGTNSIAIDQLPSGTYIVRMDNGKGDSYNEKISKQ